MRFIMRQKLLSLAVSFTIKDQNDRVAYHVKGESFRLGNKLSLQDGKGNELVHIDQRLLTWGLTYELWRDGGRPGLPATLDDLHHNLTDG